MFLFSIEASNGATYEGQFQKGLPNGLGVMRFPDSSRYEGEFMQGWFHGHGVFTTLDGTKFEGTVWVKKVTLSRILNQFIAKL